ncbi:MFS transporter [Prauserella marina]|uniref:Sugar phosphate permease n=1 Tax=Prauserella marina TaxID=530584 RepID=A0A222VJG0_9PSEU|nr:MFS transporter [Prauserella marina]ASR34045.1 MFS transporter [Prauserella marina]PWV82679.1 sugar phosphate permease [Prauserella marina]SDC74547.1 Sugar phosphate permease [Prauserella marina]
MTGSEPTPERGTPFFPEPGQRNGTRYRALWTVLLLGWVVSYADRTLTGPVVSWMLANDVGFIADASDPRALGGLIGSLFFTGYMLTQYPGGRLGDRFGHREMIVLSLLWAAVMTAVSGIVVGLIAFVGARVLTGLGEGVFYSNDRTLILNHTPPKRRTLGLGVVISGLSIGLTIGIVCTPLLIEWGESLGMGGESWRAPFLVFAAVSLVVAGLCWYFFHRHLGGKLRLGPPFLRLLAVSIPLLAAVLALFIVADELRWPTWGTAVGSGVLAVLVIGIIVGRLRSTPEAATLLSRDIVIIYIAYIAILWNLWFFSFWSVEIVREATESSLLAAALTAAFNAGAGILGFPAGGWLADRALRKGYGRKPLLVSFSAIYSLLVFTFALSISGDGEPSLFLLGLILFCSGLFFNALQPIAQGITGDLVPDKQRGSAFGLLNLVSEIGAVASPVVSGVLRDATGSWAVGTWVAGGIMLASAVMYLLVREKRPVLTEE